MTKRVTIIIVLSIVAMTGFAIFFYEMTIKTAMLFAMKLELPKDSGA